MACCPPVHVSTSDTTRQTKTALVHIHLHVPDLSRAQTFYRAFFGEEPIKAHPGYAKFIPSWAPLNLALSQGGITGPSAPLSHFGVQLPSSLLVGIHLARIQTAGLATRIEMGVNCCFANQDKFWVRDPLGNEWEVYYLNHDLDVATGEALGSVDCCVPTQHFP
jgi:catechol 2,3-dioxygenase-like lactoylglutathione lyase family enzyme